jgi:hypothetical protein
VSETGALPNRRAAYKPPKPPPTITTRCADAIAYGMHRLPEMILCGAGFILAKTN